MEFCSIEKIPAAWTPSWSYANRSLIDGIQIGGRFNIASPLTAGVTQGTPSMGNKRKHLFFSYFFFCLRICFFLWQPESRQARHPWEKQKTIFILFYSFCDRVPLIARSWDPGSEEVETQGGNGRKWESERGRERVKSVAFACKMT